MAPYTGDIRIQGLHVSNVLNAARALVAKLAGFGGAQKVVGAAVLEELTELESAVNRLAQFEREAKTRGTLKHTTDADDLAQALDAARGLLSATPGQRDALHMSEEESAAAFDSDELFADAVAEAPPAVEGGGPDPMGEPDGADAPEDPFAVP